MFKKVLLNRVELFLFIISSNLLFFNCFAIDNMMLFKSFGQIYQNVQIIWKQNLNYFVKNMFIYTYSK